MATLHPKQILFMNKIISDDKLLDYVYDYRIKNHDYKMTKYMCRKYVQNRLTAGEICTNVGNAIMNEYREAYLEYKKIQHGQI